MQLTTWRRLAALALLLAAALAVAGCDRRASDPALPSTGSTLPGTTPSITPRTGATTPDSSTGGTSGGLSGSLSGGTYGSTPGGTPGSTPGTTTTGSGMRALDSLTPALPAASAASR